MDHKEIGRKVVDWIHLTHVNNHYGAVVSKTSDSIKGGEFLDWLSD